MINHISIPAKQTQLVANTLAKLIQGIVKPFKPLADSYMVYSNNQYSTSIEVYPHNITLQPGKKENDPCQFISRTEANYPYSTVHMALTVELNREAVFTIAKNVGWRSVLSRRSNAFNVIEVWIENHFMLEVIAKEDSAEALAALRSR